MISSGVGGTVNLSLLINMFVAMLYIHHVPSTCPHGNSTFGSGLYRLGFILMELHTVSKTGFKILLIVYFAAKRGDDLTALSDLVI